MTLRQIFQVHRFTCDAIELIEQTFDRSVKRSVDMRGPCACVMYLWSVVRWEITLAMSILHELSGSVDVIESHLKPLLADLPRDNSRRVQGQAPIKLPCDGIEQLCQEAASQAKSLGHDWTGSEHLLLAAVIRAEPSLKSVLDSCHITEASVREAINNRLSGPYSPSWNPS